MQVTWALLNQHQDLVWGVFQTPNKTVRLYPDGSGPSKCDHLTV